MTLTKDQIARYSRQLILPELGVAGQERLIKSSVLLVGAGGLGSPAALYLAAAGVGTIGIIDPEAVAVSNLHRQILHAAGDVGRPKTQSAAVRLQAINPSVAVRPIQDRLSAENALEHLRAYDLVLDGSDNFSTRYLVNDACVLSGKPLVHGAAVAFGGQAMTIVPKRSACFRCVFPEPPRAGGVPSCQDAGVLGSVVGVMGSLMAHEAIKLLAGVGEPLTDRLLVFEGVRSRFRDVPVRRDAACAVCGDDPSIRELRMIGEPMCREEALWHGGK
jgi:adenylyltransferase/sulfurtransferase